MDKNNKKRTSILKKRPSVDDELTETTISKFPKRNQIQFSQKKQVKEFMQCEENVTIWGNTYETSVGKVEGSCSDGSSTSRKISVDFTQSTINSTSHETQPIIEAEKENFSIKSHSEVGNITDTSSLTNSIEFTINMNTNERQRIKKYNPDNLNITNMQHDSSMLSNNHLARCFNNHEKVLSPRKMIFLNKNSNMSVIIKDKVYMNPSEVHDNVSICLEDDEKEGWPKLSKSQNQPENVNISIQNNSKTIPSKKYNLRSTTSNEQQTTPIETSSKIIQTVFKIPEFPKALKYNPSYDSPPIKPLVPENQKQEIEDLFDMMVSDTPSKNLCCLGKTHTPTRTTQKVVFSTKRPTTLRKSTDIFKEMGLIDDNDDRSARKTTYHNESMKLDGQKARDNNRTTTFDQSGINKTLSNGLNISVEQEIPKTVSVKNEVSKPKSVRSTIFHDDSIELDTQNARKTIYDRNIMHETTKILNLDIPAESKIPNVHSVRNEVYKAEPERRTILHNESIKMDRHNDEKGSRETLFEKIKMDETWRNKTQDTSNLDISVQQETHEINSTKSKVHNFGSSINHNETIKTDVRNPEGSSRRTIFDKIRMDETIGNKALDVVDISIESEINFLDSARNDTIGNSKVNTKPMRGTIFHDVSMKLDIENPEIRTRETISNEMDETLKKRVQDDLDISLDPKCSRFDSTIPEIRKANTIRNTIFLDDSITFEAKNPGPSNPRISAFSMININRTKDSNNLEISPECSPIGKPILQDESVKSDVKNTRDNNRKTTFDQSGINKTLSNDLDISVESEIPKNVSVENEVSKPKSVRSTIFHDDSIELDTQNARKTIYDKNIMHEATRIINLDIPAESKFPNVHSTRNEVHQFVPVRKTIHHNESIEIDPHTDEKRTPKTLYEKIKINETQDTSNLDISFEKESPVIDTVRSKNDERNNRRTIFDKIRMDETLGNRIIDNVDISNESEINFLDSARNETVDNSMKLEKKTRETIFDKSRMDETLKNKDDLDISLEPKSSKFESTRTAETHKAKPIRNTIFHDDSNIEAENDRKSTFNITKSNQTIAHDSCNLDTSPVRSSVRRTIFHDETMKMDVQHAESETRKTIFDKIGMDETLKCETHGVYNLDISMESEIDFLDSPRNENNEANKASAEEKTQAGEQQKTVFGFDGDSKSMTLVEKIQLMKFKSMEEYVGETSSSSNKRRSTLNSDTCNATNFIMHLTNVDDIGDSMETTAEIQRKAARLIRNPHTSFSSTSNVEEAVVDFMNLTIQASPLNQTVDLNIEKIKARRQSRIPSPIRDYDNMFDDLIENLKKQDQPKPRLEIDEYLEKMKIEPVKIPYYPQNEPGYLHEKLNELLSEHIGRKEERLRIQKEMEATQFPQIPPKKFLMENLFESMEEEILKEINQMPLNIPHVFPETLSFDGLIKNKFNTDEHLSQYWRYNSVFWHRGIFKLTHKKMEMFTLNFRCQQYLTEADDSTMPIIFKKIILYLSPDYRKTHSATRRITLLQREFHRAINGVDNFTSSCRTSLELFEFLNYYHANVMKAVDIVKNFFDIITKYGAIFKINLENLSIYKRCFISDDIVDINIAIEGYLEDISLRDVSIEGREYTYEWNMNVNIIDLRGLMLIELVLFDTEKFLQINSKRTEVEMIEI